MYQNGISVKLLDLNVQNKGFSLRYQESTIKVHCCCHSTTISYSSLQFVAIGSLNVVHLAKVYWNACGSGNWRCRQVPRVVTYACSLPYNLTHGPLTFEFFSQLLTWWTQVPFAFKTASNVGHLFSSLLVHKVNPLSGHRSGGRSPCQDYEDIHE